MTLKLTIDVPDTLVRKAKQVGVFEADSFTRMLEREVQRRQTNSRFWNALEKLSASPLPPMTTEEVNAEIKAYRREKRQRRENRR
jgi:hypothetical protein